MEPAVKSTGFSSFQIHQEDGRLRDDCGSRVSEKLSMDLRTLTQDSPPLPCVNLQVSLAFLFLQIGFKTSSFGEQSKGTSLPSIFLFWFVGHIKDKEAKRMDRFRPAGSSWPTSAIRWARGLPSMPTSSRPNRFLSFQNMRLSPAFKISSPPPPTPQQILFLLHKTSDSSIKSQRNISTDVGSCQRKSLFPGWGRAWLFPSTWSTEGQ